MIIESEAETLTSLCDIALTNTAILRITGEGELLVLTSAFRHYLVGAWDEGRAATTDHHRQHRRRRPVTALDRRELIDLARDELAGWPIGSGYYGTKLDVDEAREMAEATLPAIVAAVLKPIRELHREQFQFCRDCDADYPCPTIQLCDAIESSAKGGE